jgi:DNA-binding SARP family transcriptional activator
LFGPTTMACGDIRSTATNLGGNKPRQLLEMLALDVGVPVSKELLAERLWDGHPPRAYIPTLESHVCCLRRRLGGLTGEPGALVTTVGGYLLNEQLVKVDVVEVRALLDSGDVAKVRRTLDLVQGMLLADDPYAPWADEARQGFAARSARRYAEAAHVANEVGDHELAATLARAVGHDQYWSEPAVQELMRALAASGNRAQALFEYQALRTLLDEELGIEPGPATQKLFMSILCAAPSQGSDDVGILLGLLKGALATADRGHCTSHSPAMAEVAQMLLARAVNAPEPEATRGVALTA